MNWDYLNPNWLLSRLLEKIGIKTYLSKVEFAAHLGWSLVFCFLGSSFASLWIIYSLYDELIVDDHQDYMNEPKCDRIDFWYDIISKTALPLGYLLIVACRAIVGV